MLDRKTKNRNASVELLEDRIEENKTFMKLFVFIGTMVMIFSLIMNQFAYYYDLSESTISLCTIMFILGLSLFGLSLFVFMENVNIGTLIYLKQHIEGNKNVEP